MWRVIQMKIDMAALRSSLVAAAYLNVGLTPGGISLVLHMMFDDERGVAPKAFLFGSQTKN